MKGDERIRTAGRALGADPVYELLRDLESDIRQIAECTPHKQGCDEPDDPSCARCIADSYLARLEEAIAGRPRRWFVSSEYKRWQLRVALAERRDA